jgi:DNA-binding LacI/PurR family transcriptional regulator
MKMRIKIKAKDIAKRAKVSTATVSQVFNNPGRVNSETRKMILEIAAGMGYKRQKSTKVRLNAIGIIADNYANVILGEFYNKVVLGILEELKAQSINAMIEAFGKTEEVPPQMITKHLVDGILFLGKVSREHILMTQQKDIPLLLVGHPIPDLELHTIVSDGRSGSIQAVEHLIMLGHSKIAIISGEPAFDPVASDRLDGYRFALSKAGIKINPKYMVEADFGVPQTSYDQTMKLLDLDDPPTAIYCTSDSLAYRAYRAIADRGLKIPGDISIVGFDNISFPGYADPQLPALTTVDVDRELMGKTSVEILTDIIENPQKAVYRYTLPVRLLIKGSTGKPK